jgi:hypothetical protein
LYIIAVDENRYGYMPTYYTSRGFTYSVKNADTFNSEEDAKTALNNLIKNSNKKSYKEFYGDITGRMFSIRPI